MLQLFTQPDLNSLQSSHFLTALTDRRNSISPAGVGSEQSGHVEARILWALTDFYLKETKTGAARRHHGHWHARLPALQNRAGKV